MVAAEAGKRRQLELAGAASERTEALETRRQELQAEEAATVQALSKAQSSEQAASEDVSKVQEELIKVEAAAAELASSKVLLSQNAHLQRSEHDRAVASGERSEEELAASKAAVAAMSAQCSELHRDVEELVALASSSETARGERHRDCSMSRGAS